MRFFSERMASLGCTVLDLITSEISRLRAMSSLEHCQSLLAGSVVQYQAPAFWGVGHGNIQTAARCLVDLLIKSGICARRPPSHHRGECCDRGLLIGGEVSQEIGDDEVVNYA
jgi:hypothetical protein